MKKEHGPLDSDSDCLTWVYHSHVHAQNDVNTGLVGNNENKKWHLFTDFILISIARYERVCDSNT